MAMAVCITCAVSGLRLTSKTRMSPWSQQTFIGQRSDNLRESAIGKILGLIRLPAYRLLPIPGNKRDHELTCAAGPSLVLLRSCAFVGRKPAKRLIARRSRGLPLSSGPAIAVLSSSRDRSPDTPVRPWAGASAFLGGRVHAQREPELP